MRRALAKPHPTVVAVDDGAFRRGDVYAPIAAVVVRLPERLEAARVGRVRVDGTDGTRQVLRLVRSLGPLEGARALLLDGAVVGGFNVLDLDLLHEATRLPVVAVTRRPPEFSRIAAALRRWFPRSAEARLGLLRAHRLAPVPTGGKPILAASAGCRAEDAAWLLRRAAARGFWPEPLRLAHLVASSAAPGRRTVPVPSDRRGSSRTGRPRAPRRRSNPNRR
ncbi:MAG TPA: DUF99 family protein [Thermoplasmata archaeon]|nr:DUF99 family protein [Thermoplasmata archaeon]